MLVKLTICNWCISPSSVLSLSGPIGWGCRIHRVHLSQWVPRYDKTQSDGEVPEMLELWGMLSTSSLPSFPDPLWLGVVIPDRVLSMGQIKLNCVITLNWIVWNKLFLHLTVCLNGVLMQNWIVWNGTVFLYKNEFGMK